jgi:hypothetical protein
MNTWAGIIIRVIIVPIINVRIRHQLFVTPISFRLRVNAFYVLEQRFIA